MDDATKKILEEIDAGAARKRSSGRDDNHTGGNPVDPLYFALYFAAAILLIIAAVRRSWSKIQDDWSRSGASLLLAVLAIAVKWSCGLAFFISAPAGLDSLLMAYQRVSEDAFGWCWSSMLFGWVVTAAYAVPNLVPEISGFAMFIVLAMGELVSFSAAFPLLFFLTAQPACLDGKSVSFNSAMVLVAGHTAMLGIQLSADKAFQTTDFRVTLAMLHIVILLPAVTFRNGRIPLSYFLRAAGLLSAFQHFYALGNAMSVAPSMWAYPNLVLHGLVRNLLQFSVGVDGILAHFQVQLFLGHDRWRVLDDTFLAMLISPGSVFAWRLLGLLPKKDEVAETAKNDKTKKSD